MKEKMAIIGTGIAGMSAAYFLKEKYELTIYEKNNYVGGHTNTVAINDEISFDTGFMVFNEVTYPLLTKLFKKLNVPYYDTSMSFGVSNKIINMEFNGSSLDGLFSQRKNLLSPRFIKMLLQINRFNKEAPNFLNDNQNSGLTLGDFVKKHNFGDDMKDLFLIPMSSAVWSTPHEDMNNFPIKTLIQFFYNHGFLGLDTQHQWKTVEGGSKTYREKLIHEFKGKIRTNSPAQQVRQVDEKIEIVSNGVTETFDKVIFASHADETLSMLEKPTAIENDLLQHFKYQKNIATIHTDEQIMPRTKKVWSSWNYITQDGPSRTESYTVYYMNSLQKLKTKTNYFININGEKFIDPKKIIKEINYHHPVFDTNTAKAQNDLGKLNVQENRRIYFCGSYFRYGFHEDALLSSVNLCETLLGKELLK
jgi:predicted NAD/FAD-binding protein